MVGLAAAGGAVWLMRSLGERGRATVIVYDDGHPAQGRWVVFHDASGAIAATTRTGEGGEAAGPVGSAGSMITVAYGESIRHAITVGGVNAGDRVVVGEEEDDERLATTVCTAAVALPSAHPKAAAHTLTLGVGATPMRDPTQPVAMGVLERFVEDGGFFALAEALDAEGEAVAFAHARFDGCRTDAGRVDARLPAWSEDFRRFEIELTGAEAPLTVEGRFWLAGAGSDRLERGHREATASQAVTLRFAAPAPLGAKAGFRVAVNPAKGCERAVLEQRRAVMPQKLRVPLNELLLPPVLGVTVEPSGVGGPVVKWQVGSGAGAPDAVVLRAEWPQTREHVWTFVLPPDGGDRLTLPALPEELAEWRPDARFMSVAVARIEASFVNGFAEVKAKGLGEFADPEDVEESVLRYSVCGELDF